MHRFDSNCVYVLGAVTTRYGDDPMSLEKARADGVRVECLPLDRFGEWTASRKSLPLDRVLSVLATLAQLSSAAYSDEQVDDAWRTAFSRHVPELLLARPPAGEPEQTWRGTGWRRTLRVQEISVFESLVRSGTRFSYNSRYEALRRRLGEA
jgi:hypothetical protein